MEFPDGTVKTPIGVVKLGDRQHEKLSSLDRKHYFGLIRPTLENPAYVVSTRETDEQLAVRREIGETPQRASKLEFIRAFVREDGEHQGFLCVTVSRGAIEVSVSSGPRRLSELARKVRKGAILTFDLPYQGSPQALGAEDGFARAVSYAQFTHPLLKSNPDALALDLLAKAEQLGLFDIPVNVKPSIRKDGTVVRGHVATRRKRLAPKGKQPELFGAAAPKDETVRLGRLGHFIDKHGGYRRLLSLLASFSPAQKDTLLASMAKLAGKSPAAILDILKTGARHEGPAAKQDDLFSEPVVAVGGDEKANAEPKPPAFTPTHELPDGTQVVAHAEEPNVWVDAQGDEYESEEAYPLSPQDPVRDTARGKLNTAKEAGVITPGEHQAASEALDSEGPAAAKAAIDRKRKADKLRKPSENSATGRRRSYNDHQESEAIRLYLSGLSMLEVERRTGIDDQAVKALLIRNGIELRPNSLKPSYSDEIRQEAIRLYTDERKSAAEVARRLGLKTHTVKEWVAAAGVVRGMSEAAANSIANGGKRGRSNSHYLWHSEKTGEWNVAHSTFEGARMKQLDEDAEVSYWSACRDRIPYIDPITGAKRHYVPDLYVELSDGSIRVEEIKPDRLIDAPANKAKAEAARAFYAKSGVSYLFITESGIGAEAIRQFRESGVAAASQKEMAIRVSERKKKRRNEILANETDEERATRRAIDAQRAREKRAKARLSQETRIIEKPAGAKQDDEAPRMRTYGWDAVKLSDAYTLKELDALRQRVEREHENPKDANGHPLENGRSTIYLYDKKGRQKLDRIGWAVKYKLDEKRRQEASKPGDAPQEGERNAKGLVFRDGRWRREDSPEARTAAIDDMLDAEEAQRGTLQKAFGLLAA